MSTGSTCFDANILLEIILTRKQEEAARKTLAEAGSDLSISTLSAHLVIHFGRERTSLAILKQFLADYQLLALEAVDFEWAFNNRRDDDFEDALQLAVAIRYGCDRFITLDNSLYKTYKDLPTIRVVLASL